MPRLGIVLASAVTSLFCASGAFQMTRSGQSTPQVGSGGAYTNDSTGAFGQLLCCWFRLLKWCWSHFRTTGRSRLDTRLISKSWGLTKGTTFPIDIVFDGQHQFPKSRNRFKREIDIGSIP